MQHVVQEGMCTSCVHDGMVDTCDVFRTLGALTMELAQMRPRREALQWRLEAALSTAVVNSAPLSGCRLEVVGSTSWGGDVPESDVDMVLVTPQGVCGREQHVAALAALQQCLFVADGEEVELIETASVPILKVHSNYGVRCDVSLDQHRAFAHRNHLFRLMAKRPRASDLVRLVKLWLRRRGLPFAADGGLPSLAWALVAVGVVESRPDSMGVDALLCEFFVEMQRLVDHSLRLRSRSTEAGACFEWIPRDVSENTWADEWTQLVSVEDPCDPSFIITPPSMPVALAILHIVEMKLALNAIREGRWGDLWQPRDPQVPDRTLHVFFVDGKVYVGQLSDFQCSGISRRSGSFHSRDCSSQLGLRICTLAKGAAYTPYAKVSATARMTCHPCHWVCPLPTGPLKPNNTTVLRDEGLRRLAEIVQVVGITRVSPDLCDTVLAWRRAHAATLPPSIAPCVDCAPDDSTRPRPDFDESFREDSNSDISAREVTDSASVNTASPSEEDDHASVSTHCTASELMSTSVRVVVSAPKPRCPAVEWKPTLQRFTLTTTKADTKRGAVPDGNSATLLESSSATSKYLQMRDISPMRLRSRRGSRQRASEPLSSARWTPVTRPEAERTFSWTSTAASVNDTSECDRGTRQRASKMRSSARWSPVTHPEAGRTSSGTSIAESVNGTSEYNHGNWQRASEVRSSARWKIVTHPRVESTSSGTSTATAFNSSPANAGLHSPSARPSRSRLRC